jgi:aminopeptidase N
MRVLCLVAWICAPHSTSPGATLPYREKDYRALHYEAELAPDVATRSLRGNVSIRIVSAAASLPVVALDADELVIEKAVEDGRPLAVEITPGLARIRLTRPARHEEERTIRIWYHAQPKRGMWFLADGWWYTGFHTEAWLPCDASPADRSTFTIHWIVPAAMNLIGTGDETERAKLPDNGDRERRTIRLDEPYPAYLVGAVAGPLRTSCIDAGAVRICASIDRQAKTDLQPALETARDALPALTQWAGVAFPRKRYDQIFLPNRIGGQELVGMALLSERYLGELVADRHEDWLIVHELIHSWWGNRITCRSWNDFWLNEGLTTFLQAAFKEVKWGPAAYEKEIANAHRRYDDARRAGKERALSYKDWKTPPDASGPITYSKGALVFELLRRRLGEQAFWSGLRAYTLAGLATKSGVTSADLERAMETASGQALKPLFDACVYGAGPPPE